MIVKSRYGIMARLVTGAVLGTTIPLTDVIASNVSLKSVFAGFESQRTPNPDGSSNWYWLSGYPVSATLSGATSKLSSVTAKISFAALPVGSYRYYITASDSSGVSKQWEQLFSVVASPSYTSTINGCTITMSPDITVVPVLVWSGSSITMTGTITASNCTIATASARIDKLGGETVYSGTNNPGGSSFSMSKLDSALSFSKLPLGVYTYYLIVKDSKGATHQLTVKAFTVKKAATCIPYVDAYTPDDQFPVPSQYKNMKTGFAMAQIAFSQIGYHEGTYKAASGSSPACVQFPTSNNWTKYGQTPHVEWGTHDGSSKPWCALFASWVAWQAGMTAAQVSTFVSTTAGATWYKDSKDSGGKSRLYYHNGGRTYVPKPGDIVFFHKGIKYQHTGLVYSYDSKSDTLITIEGNSAIDNVKIKVYTICRNSTWVYSFGSNS